MTFEHPELLWLLLGAVPILVLHLVRRRRRREAVSSLLLWEEVRVRAAHRIGLGRLIELLSLLLMLLSTAAIALSAASPVVGHPRPPARPLLLLVGTSARMQGKRWQRAIAIVRDELAKKASYDPVTLMLVSNAPRVPVRAVTDPARVLAAVDRARPGLVRAGWRLAAPALSGPVARGDRVVAIGVAPRVLPGVAVRTVGGKNAGITRFGVRSGRRRVEVRVRAGGDVKGRELVFRVGGKEVKRVPASETKTVEIDRQSGGRLEVALEPPAGPSFDDTASAFLRPPERLKVGVASPNGPNPFLFAALRVLSPLLDTEGSGVLPLDRIASAQGVFDVLVVAGEAPRKLPAGDTLLLGPAPSALGLSPVSAVKVSPVWEVAADHPVTRGVDTAEVEVLGARPAHLPPGAVPLISVPEGAVAAAGERAGTRWVWIGLGPGNSTLPVTGAFPLLLRNTLRWFAALHGAVLPPAVAEGEVIRPVVPLSPGVSAVSASGPGDAPDRLVPVSGGRFSYLPPPGTAGRVEIRIGSRVEKTWVNPLLPAETEAVPEKDKGPPPPDRSHLAGTRRHLFKWFAVAAVVLLLLEWGLGRLSRGP